jgi:hypothetical protein
LSQPAEPRKKKAVKTTRGSEMKKEYDFAGGVRGKFYRVDARLNLPIYLDKDISEFIQNYATRKKIDRQTVVNRMLRGSKEIIQSLQ